MLLVISFVVFMLLGLPLFGVIGLASIIVPHDLSLVTAVDAVFRSGGRRFKLHSADLASVLIHEITP